MINVIEERKRDPASDKKAEYNRHKSLFVPKGKESRKWLQEYSGFNLQEMQESLIKQVKIARTSSLIPNSIDKRESIGSRMYSDLNGSSFRNSQVFDSSAINIESDFYADMLLRMD